MVLKINKSRIREIYISMFLFVLIFAPPVLPHTNLILSIFSIGMLTLKHRKDWFYVFRKSGQLQWAFTIFIMFIYAFCIILVNAALFNEQVQVGHYTALFNRFFILLLSLIPSSLYIICYFRRNGLSSDDFIKGVIRAGLMQCVCVFASFFSEDIKAIFIYFMKTFGDSSIYDNTWYITVRSYGFAKGLADLFGLGMGLIAGISYMHGVYKEKRYVVYSVFIAIAGTLSARSTIIVYIIAIIAALVYMLLGVKVKRLLMSLLFIVVGGMCVINVLPFIKEVSPYTYNWLMQAVDSMLSFFVDDEVTGTFSVLFSDDFWQIPNPFQVIFGSGHSLYNARGYKHSDVGYINDMWFIGIVGICFVYGTIAYFLWRITKKNQNSMNKMCVLFLGIAVLVFNVKAGVFGYNPGAAVLFAMIFGLNCLESKK